MANKLIKGIDEETWRRFIAYCKIKNTNAGDELNRILKDSLEKNFNKVLRGGR